MRTPMPWLLLLNATLGCTTQDIKQLGYATVQNAKQQQCLQYMRNDCGQQQSYDAYQRERPSQ